jgi:MFS family permease
MQIRHPTPYAWLWSSTTSGALAEGISLSVLPLLISNLTRDPVVVSTLQVAAALPWLAFGLQAGALADRWDRARVLFFADAARTGLTTVLAVLVLFHSASVMVLLGFAFCSSIATVMFCSADGALLPSLVSSDELAEANGRLKTGTTITGNFVGPGLGSALFALTHSSPVFTQAAAFATSMLCLRALPKRLEPRGPSGLSLRSEITQGLTHVRRDRDLFTLAGTTTLQGIATWMLMAILVLYSLETLHASPAAYGLLFTIYAVGSLTGASLAGRIAARMKTRTSLTLTALLSGVALFILAATSTFAVAAAGMALLGMSGMILGILAVSERQRRTPEHLLGRVSGVFNVLNVGSAPVAAPISGLIAAHWGLPTAIAVCGLTFCLAAILLRLGLPESTTANAQDAEHGTSNDETPSNQSGWDAHVRTFVVSRQVLPVRGSPRVGDSLSGRNGNEMNRPVLTDQAASSR